MDDWIEIIRGFIVAQGKDNLRFLNADYLTTWMWYSREQLNFDYGESYVKAKITESQMYRHYLKTCGKPKTDVDIIDIWMAKLIISQNLKFERSY